MTTTMTATEIMQDIYRGKSWTIYEDIRLRLRAWRDLSIPWERWGKRNVDIIIHKYARFRDKTRAYRRNDFRLAKELDETTETST